MKWVEFNWSSELQAYVGTACLKLAYLKPQITTAMQNNRTLEHICGKLIYQQYLNGVWSALGHIFGY